jgi:hypothetical protein
MGGDHGLALQESPDPSHEGSAVVALVRGCGRPGPCRIVAANLLTNRFTAVSRPARNTREPVLGCARREAALPLSRRKDLTEGERPRGKLGCRLCQPAPGNQSDYLSQYDISGTCACRDEVKNLTGSHSKILGHVRRNIRRSTVGCHNGGAADGRPQRKRGCNPHLIGLCAKWCGELRSVCLSCSDLSDNRPQAARIVVHSIFPLV